MRKLVEPEIVVATHNAGKLREIGELIAPFGIKAKSARDHRLAEPEETGTTFEENAHIKALAAMQATGLPALSDDSGLCVEGLGGEPGIHTADWAEKPDGSGRDFALAMEKVEKRLQAAGCTQPDQRKACFVATLCMIWPDNHVEYFRGEAPGHLVWPPRGQLGFGYDPVFQPLGHTITFGEMTPQQKHAWDITRDDDGLSHRARAFALFARSCLMS